MNGYQRISRVFETDKDIRLMSHVVGGYPDIETCESLISLMFDKGADLVEVQLPFSDPPADGPVIVAANHAALKSGVTTVEVIKMIERVKKKVNKPILIMSYLNPIYAIGIENFINTIHQTGIDGLIIPDYPPDESDLNLSELAAKKNIAVVPLIAPSTEPARMKLLSEKFISPFVYAVLRYGVTGKKTELNNETKEYIDRIKKYTGKYVAAGFGISEKEQLININKYADCGVIGSALIRRINDAIENNKDVLTEAESFFNNLIC